MENKIEIGEYVRTDKGYIFKIEHNKMVQGLELLNIQYGNIINHSKNIIDLVEVGDYVNGYIVRYKKENRIDIGEGEDCFWLRNENIENILTHEQYERNCYRLEE